MAAIIKTEDLHFSYPAAEGVTPVVLDGVSLSIEEGSFVAVLGHNGCGKSTLAKHMNAILLPSGGTVYVDGIDTADDSRLLDIRRAVGMVFQNPDNQIVANVVEEDVAFAPENLGVPPAEIRQRVDDALKAVNMYDHREHAPHLLSGGQKQRVAIAGVIAMQPRCIVLDHQGAEPDQGGDGGPYHPPHGRGRPGRPAHCHGKGQGGGRRRAESGLLPGGGAAEGGPHRPPDDPAPLGAAPGGVQRPPRRPQRRGVRSGAVSASAIKRLPL